jgi:hypothetical protein
VALPLRKTATIPTNGAFEGIPYASRSVVRGRAGEHRCPTGWNRDDLSRVEAVRSIMVVRIESPVVMTASGNVL